MILRGLAFVAGVLLLAATAHVTISSIGGYWQPHAALVAAIALGVGVGAVSIGAALETERRRLATWLIAAIACGEAFGFLLTAERLVTAREAAQAPLRAALDARTAAEQRVRDAHTAAGKTPSTSPRLQAALARQEAVGKTVGDKSAERGCVENCRMLLQAQVTEASAEVAAARAEIAGMRRGVEVDLAEAQTALAGLQVPPSATPLADRLGLPAWLVDLIYSALGSMAANGLACGLIAFAAYHRPRETKEPASAEPAPLQATPPPEPAPLMIAPAVPASRVVGLFLKDQLRRELGAEVDAGSAYPKFASWSARNEMPQVEYERFEALFKAYCVAADLETRTDESGCVHARDLTVLEHTTEEQAA
jgi:hypothetical protein